MGGVEAVFLCELARRHLNTTPVQNSLHSFKYILSVRRCCSISLLLAVHNYSDDFPKLYRCRFL